MPINQAATLYGYLVRQHKHSLDIRYSYSE